MLRHRIVFLIVGFGLFGLSGCRKEFKAPIVENEILAPIFHTEVTIDKIVPDSLRSETNDGLISLVYRRSLYDAALGSFEPLQTRTFKETATLQKLSLGTKTAVREVSLGQVALAEGGLVGNLILELHDSIAPIPGFLTGLSYGPILVDGSAFFESVTLDSGYMDVTIENGFPTGISNVSFELRNDTSGTLIGSETFDNVPANASETKTLPLHGKQLERVLRGDILNFDIDGTGGNSVPIDTADQIIVTIRVYDTKLQSATAIFPAQNVIELKDTNQMKNVNDLRLTKARAKTGKVHMEVFSTVDDTLYFDYLIPSGTKEGVALELHETIRPGSEANPTKIVLDIPVNGYTFDLTGAPLYDSYNAFYSELTGRIDSTGIMRTISLEDEITVQVSLQNFVPEYVEGYLGNTLISAGPTEIPLTLFKSIESGTIAFDNVSVSVGVMNGNGVPFEVDVKKLEVSNSKSGESTSIDISSLENPLVVDRADDLSTPSDQTWSIDQSTSNLNDALNIFPNRLAFEMDIVSNPAMQSADLSQFGSDTNLLGAYTDIEIPLSFIANDLILRDTAEFDGTTLLPPAGLGAGTIYLIVDNTYELEAEVSLTFLKENGDKIRSLSFDQAVSSGAPGNPQNSVLEWEFAAGEILDLLASKAIIMQVELNTFGLNEPRTISTEQSLDATMTSRFKYSNE